MSSLNLDVIMHRLTCLSNYSALSISIAKSSMSNDGSYKDMREDMSMLSSCQLWSRYISEGLSFVAVDYDQRPKVVFLAAASSKKAVTPGIILIQTSFVGAATMLEDVARQFFGHIGRLASLDVRTNDLSYKIVPFP